MEDASRQGPLEREVLDNAADWLQGLLANPAWFLNPKEQDARLAALEARALVKCFSDFAQQSFLGEQLRAEDGGTVVQDFEKEQIWEQMEVQNVPLRRQLRHRVARLAKAPKGAVDLQVAGAAGSAEVAEHDAASKPEAVADKKKQSKVVKDRGEKRAKAPRGEVKAVTGAKNDRTSQDFFSFEEMDKFTDLADAGKVRLEDDADDSDFALLEGADEELGEEDDTAKGAMFSDFFGDPGAVRQEGAAGEEDASESELSGAGEGEACDELSEEEQALERQLQKLQSQTGGKGDEDGPEDEDAEEEGDEKDVEEEESDDGRKTSGGTKEPQSLYEMDRRLRSLEDEVAKLEEEQLGEKTWSMKGEVSSRQRPLNSLLEVHLDQPMSSFAGRRADDEAAAAAGGNPLELDGADDADGAADAVRSAANFNLDSIIQHRIWDEAFDDVIKTTALPPALRRRYEDKDAVETLNFEKSRVGLGDIYAKQYEAEVLGHKTDGEVKEGKDKLETKALFAKLMYKLDSLTNAHFTPRPPMLGVSGDLNIKAPSIKMEDTIPLMMSQSSVKAPEELRAPRRHDRESSELVHEERKAVRRARKAKRKRNLERKLDEGTMTLGTMRQREKHLADKNTAEKKARREGKEGVVKEAKKRIKASELMEQAAKTLSEGTSRKEEVRRQRQVRDSDAPTSKRLKL